MTRTKFVLAGLLIAGLQSNSALAYEYRDGLSGLIGGLAPAGAFETTAATEAIKARVEALLAGQIVGEDEKAIALFYETRGYQPEWTAEGRLTPAAQAVIFRIGRADFDGLDPKAYLVPDIYLGRGAQASVEELAEADIMLSRAILSYGHDAAVGRLNPGSISPNIGYRPVAPNPLQILVDVTEATRPADALAAFNPTSPAFVALRQQLALERSRPAPEIGIQVPAGRLLRPGTSDERVLALRQRLEITTDVAAPEVFDAELVAAVRVFQETNGLSADGVVGPNTYAALNGEEPLNRVNEIIANLEQLRWLPRDLGNFYVHVNVPNFSLEVRKDGAIFHETRVVVGTIDNQTPIFADQIEHIVVNPYWNVPTSITGNELLPIIRRDPGYIARNNYQVFGRGGAQLDPYGVDWSSVSANQVSIRQRPGAGNALGEVKFLFPNQYAVYLHDTPSKNLFNNPVRAYSHGCMRVQNPWDFAAALLDAEPGMSFEGLRGQIGGGEKWNNLTTPIPVYITYLTAFVDKDGQLVFRNDIYGHTAKIEEALGLDSPTI
ncbi:MAG: L,D-transpeptidase family protein [Bauldia sp.]|nr:L,D-transpeptidase family protein [Bauldia sp.]